jgi:hypothetical protein
MTDRPLKDSSDAELLRAIGEFNEMIADLVPRGFQPPYEWKFAATAFMARFGDQLSSMAVLIERHHYTDAALVLRSIYESCVMFCWISADPDARFPLWMDHSERGRSVAINEANERFGIEVPEDEIDRVDRGRDLRRLDGVANLARVADEHWSERIDAFRPIRRGPEGLLTLSGFYTAVYRAISRAAHAEAESIDPVVALRTDHVVITSETKVRRRPFHLGFCISMVGFAMIVYEHQFGGFDTRLIGDISRRLGEPLVED